MRNTPLARLLARGRETGENQSLVSDIAKVGSIPESVLFSVLDKVAQSYPTNIAELAKIEARKAGIEPDDLFDAASAVTYLWQNSDGESVDEILLDLSEASLLQDKDDEPVRRAFDFLCPSLRSSQVAGVYKALGPPTLMDISGTVDLRCRFHSSVADFHGYGKPESLMGVQPTIIVNLVLGRAGEDDSAIVFQMDENDLAMLNRFTQLVARELEIAKTAQIRLETAQI